MAAWPVQKHIIIPVWRSVDLSGMHTKVLLKLLGYARRRRTDVLPMPDGTELPVHYIRVELAKREHVPNKVETPAHHQEAARGRDRRRKVSGYRRRGDEA